mmetsp:Transcript_66828/g.216019  ORF Transcript_66828/g.216019 Transcript_66828/m.216019 type:complete len:105 (-) Transcript_66828:132-446(-)
MHNIGLVQEWELAVLVLDKMVQHQLELNSFYYNAVVGACTRSSDVSKAFELMSKIKAASVELDAVAYSLLIKARLQHPDGVLGLQDGVLGLLRPISPSSSGPPT